jgi:hypothetical protein
MLVAYECCGPLLLIHAVAMERRGTRDEKSLNPCLGSESIFALNSPHVDVRVGVGVHHKATPKKSASENQILNHCVNNCTGYDIIALTGCAEVAMVFVSKCMSRREIVNLENEQSILNR